MYNMPEDKRIRRKKDWKLKKDLDLEWHNRCYLIDIYESMHRLRFKVAIHGSLEN